MPDEGAQASEGAPAKEGAPRPIAVALVGYGYAGRTFHAPLIAAVPGLRLALVVSSDAAKVRADLPGVSVESASGSWSAHPEIDVVVVATPNDTHLDLALRALRAGKHVVVDKPFTVTPDEARELAAVARGEGRILSVFHNRRWDADFLTIRRLVASGALGEPVYFESHFDRFRPEVRARWREDAARGGGLWLDLGSHLVDQAVQLFGPPSSVFADLGAQRAGATAIDYFHVLLRYPRLRAVLHGSALVAGGTPRFVVHGTAGSFVKRGLDTQEEWLKRAPPGGEGWGRDPCEGTLYRAGPGGVERERVPTTPGDYRAYYAALQRAIAAGGAAPVTADEAVLVMDVLERAVASAAAGRELAVTRAAAPGAS